MKHARANLTHFHCTKSTLTTYFHIFFPPLIARSLSLVFYFFLFLSSFSLRYNSLSFASYFPFHHFSRYSFFLSSQYLFLLFYLYTHVHSRVSHPVYPHSSSCPFILVPQFPLSPSTRYVWSIRKQCRDRSRASALFSLNKFNLNFPAVRSVY